ncbi:hypothetical protein Gbth_033_012 [Gluconobacter thailandicus F149-1 = NBRC 100600]|nr:hypothetical protein Gbth_033_012 [Gluconobacter thailandicus F149-1 = NBRC 100600]GBR60709.1 hypothetical protein AA100600_2241 [Gluconobacter thailandicus F149-1 = NBRC 100600]GEL88260.1 hypothetical protein GTH01_26180 [Gluconobacter thailandicus F149-1 = NBRC 100600]
MADLAPRRGSAIPDRHPGEDPGVAEILPCRALTPGPTLYEVVYTIFQINP